MRRPLLRLGVAGSLLVAAAVTLTASPELAGASPAIGAGAGRVLIAFEPGVSDATARQALTNAGADGTDARVRGTWFYDATTPDVGATVRKLAGAATTQWVEPEIFFTRQSETTGPDRDAMRIDQAQAAAVTAGTTFTGTNARVAVIDDGVDASLPDLAGRVSDGGDFTGAYTTPGSPPPGGTTPNGPHGTAVASIIAAAADDQGVRGVAPEALIRSYKVFADATGTASSIAVADAITRAVYDSAQVIVCAFDSPFESQAVRGAIDLAQDHGAVVVAAAGNDGGYMPRYPAATRNVLAVGASRRDSDGVWRVAPFSNRSSVDVLAPGVDVPAWVNGSVATMTGTSAATAEVAGEVADLVGIGVHGDHARGAVVAGHTAAAPRPGVSNVALGMGNADALDAWDLGHNNKPFSAFFFEAGATMSPTAGQSFDVLHYSPTAGDSPKLPSFSLSDSRFDYFVHTDLGPDALHTAAVDGGTMSYSRGGVNSLNLPEGTEATLTARRTGERTVTQRVRIMAAGAGVHPIRSSMPLTETRTLDATQRPSLARYVGATAGDTITITATAPAGADVDPADGRALVGLWAPWDVNGDGTTDMSYDQAPTVDWVPQLTATPSGTSYRLTYVAPVTGVYVAAVRLLDRGTGGAWTLHVSVPTPRSAVIAPAVDTAGMTYPRYGFKLGWGATTLLSHVQDVDAQVAHRFKRANGSWATTRWKDYMGAQAKSFQTNFDAKPGMTYLFRARSDDYTGNYGPWSAVKTTHVPIDDRNDKLIHYSGPWAAGSASPRVAYGAWIHTRDTTRPAAPLVATLKIDARRFGLLGRRTSTAASYKVWIDGHYRGVVSSAGTGNRQVLWTSALLSRRTRSHTLKIQAVPTASRPHVWFDGVVVYQ